MAEINTQAEILKTYLTGALSYNGNQTDPQASLGGYRSLLRLPGMAVQVYSEQLYGLQILYVSGGNTVGIGTLQATGADTIRWKDAGGSYGDTVTIANGETKVVATTDATAYIIVKRTDAAHLNKNREVSISMPVEVYERIDEIVGHATEAQTTAGVTFYRGFILNPVSDVTGLVRYVMPIGTSVGSDVGQLGASGAGTVETTGSFADWKDAGWCRRENAAGELQEIFFYSERTATELTVPAYGRGLLGTSASAGASDDNLYCVPPIAFGLDPSGLTWANYAIQRVSDGVSAPTGVTAWETGVSASDGLTIGSVHSITSIGVWMKVELPAGMPANVEIPLQWADYFVADGTGYTTKQKHRMRAAAANTAGYNTYIGYDAYPDLTADSDDYSATLPATLSPTLPSAGNTTALHIVTRNVNSFGLESGNVYPTVLTIDENGDEVLSAMTVPVIMGAVGISDDGVRVYVRYGGFGLDNDPGTEWRLYASTSGAPDPGTDIAVFSGTIYSKTAQIDIGPYEGGQTLYLALTVYRGADGEQSASDTLEYSIGADPQNPVPVPIGTEEIDYTSYETQVLYQDVDNYVLVNDNESSITFHVGGNTGAVFYEDEVRCTIIDHTPFETEESMSSVIEFHGDEIWVGLGSPLKRVMTIGSGGIVKVANSDTFNLVAKAGIGDYIEYDGGVPATDFSVDLATVHARLAPITIGGIQNATLKAPNINTIY